MIAYISILWQEKRDAPPFLPDVPFAPRHKAVPWAEKAPISRRDL